MASDRGTGDPVDTSVFRRSETPLAHGVYGLLLTLATLGELINHDADASEATAWLLGAGAVLFAAHVFSDVLAKTAATRIDPRWSGILSVGGAELAVLFGFVGAALIMAVAALGDLDAGNALLTCLVLGLLTVAGISFYSTSHHAPLVRLAMAALAAGLGAIIVVLENTL